MTDLIAPALTTRAVIRDIEPGNDRRCSPDYGGCGTLLKFAAHIPAAWRIQVIANVYYLGRWNRTECWHVPCYVRRGMPYGWPPEMTVPRLLDVKNAYTQLGADTAPEIIVEHLIALGVKIHTKRSHLRAP